MNRRLLIAAVVVVGLGLATLVRVWLALENQAYHPPVRSLQVQSENPRSQALQDIEKAAETKAKAKKYEPPTYRSFPVIGSRVAIWIVALRITRDSDMEAGSASATTMWGRLTPSTVMMTISRINPGTAWTASTTRCTR